MKEYTILTLLAAHVWLIASLALVALIILLVPYDVITINRAGRHRQIRALLWIWERTPTYTRLYMLGLLHLQRALLCGLHWLWRQAQGGILAGIADMLRRWSA
jgi:hypothetical protein